MAKVPFNDNCQIVTNHQKFEKKSKKSSFGKFKFRAKSLDFIVGKNQFKMIFWR